MSPQKLRKWRRTLSRVTKEVREKRPEIYQTKPEALDFVSRDPFAFFIGALVDTVGTDAGKAWGVPYELKERLGVFSPEAIAVMPYEMVEKAMLEPVPLHGYPRQKAHWIWLATQKICDEYGGITENIWASGSAAELKERLRSFSGIGPKLEMMIAAMLVHRYGVKFHDLAKVELPYDRHVRRVLLRTGLIHEDSRDAVAHIGRKLRPSFPAEFDDAFWGVGKEICRRKNPDHQSCLFRRLCARRHIQVTTEMIKGKYIV